MRILVVGAGFAGAVFSRLSADAGHQIEIIDKRNHIAGNCYSYKDEETGVDVHKYGPHIFHTNNKEVWLFLNRFCEFNNYVNRVKAVSNNKIYSLPINLFTINQFFNNVFSPEEAKDYINNIRINKDKIRNLEDYVLNSLGQGLYEAFYKFYSYKQWGVYPKDIALSTAKRLPIRYNYNDNYFNDIYQGIPKDGYTKIFERLLKDKLIKIKLETDFNEYKNNWRENFDHLVYCGSLDEYFDYQFGELPYRTVYFEEIREKEIQGNAVINYTDMSVDYTRIHEHKWFQPDKKFENSIGFKEYSKFTTSKNNPYYPIQNDLNMSLFKKYNDIAKNEKSVTFVGRLAQYRYYDMHQVIASSISKFKKTIGNRS